jgi:transposase
MVDDPDTAAELVSGGYEVRKSSARRGAGSGVEARVRAVRRRNWSTEDKLRIVRETLAPGAVAKVAAERHGIGTGLLFTWRREMLAAAMSGLVPVEVMPETPRVEAAVSAPATTTGAVAKAVGNRGQHLRREDGTASGGEVNHAAGGRLTEGLPPIDLAHADLT